MRRHFIKICKDFFSLYHTGICIVITTGQQTEQFENIFKISVWNFTKLSEFCYQRQYRFKILLLVWWLYYSDDILMKYIQTDPI